MQTINKIEDKCPYTTCNCGNCAYFILKRLSDRTLILPTAGIARPRTGSPTQTGETFAFCAAAT